MASENNPIYIWGIGAYGDLLGKIFNEHGVYWQGYYDNYYQANIDQVNGKTIFSGKKKNLNKDAIYVLSMRDYIGVKQQLEASGVDDEQIFYFEDISFFRHLENSSEKGLISTEKIKQLKNIHKGKRCFVIGNGPSLLIEDLDRIYESGEISFASNAIFKCYDKTRWRPTYYFCTDPKGIRELFPNKEALENVAKDSEIIFSRNNGGLSQYVGMIGNLVLLKQIYSESEEEFDFSTDCSECVYIAHTVTYVMLQIAIYMGFEEIILLGMDHSFSIEKDADGRIVQRKEVKNHAQILGDYNLWNVPELLKTTRAYEAAKRYAENHGINIYNATRGGELKVFERIDIDSVF